MLLVAVTAIDLCVANGWLVATAREDRLLDEWGMGSVFNMMRPLGIRGAHVTRVFRGTEWLPGEWEQTSSSERLAESLTWDQATLFPKHHLRWGISLIESPGTLDSLDYRVFLNVAREFGPRRTDGAREPASAALDVLSAQYYLLPAHRGGLVAEGPPLLEREVIDKWGTTIVTRDPHALPRAWIVRNVELLPPLTNSSVAANERRAREVLAPDGKLRDWRQSVVIEAEVFDYGLSDDPETRPAADGGETCRIDVDEPNRVDIAVELSRPGIVVLSDSFYRGWTAKVTSPGNARGREIPVLRANRVLRAVALPAGRHRVSFTYQPRNFLFGAALSGGGWAILAVIWIGRLLLNAKAQRRRGAEKK